MTEITKPSISQDLINDINNYFYAEKNIETDGKAGLSKQEISQYLQDTYGIDPATADKIADYALEKAGGEIKNGAQLGNALGLDTLEKTSTETFQDAIAEHFGEYGFSPSKDSAQIDFLETLVSSEKPNKPGKPGGVPGY